MSTISLAMLAGLAITTGAAAQETSNLARAAQNPIAAMISLPFQSNTNFGAGPYNRTSEILNIQPVVPIDLNPDWILVTRTIVPLIYQPDLATRHDGKFGLGDINPTFFLVPAKTGSFVWGIGPTFTMPTATDKSLGSDKWSAGPAAVVVIMTGPWVLGILANHQWSFAGKDSRKAVNASLFQPFVNYNLPGGWYLTSSPIITANWNAAAGTGKWTVPIGGGIGKIFAIEKQQVNLQLASYYNVESPKLGPDWQLRVQFTLLFPR